MSRTPYTPTPGTAAIHQRDGNYLDQIRIDVPRATPGSTNIPQPRERQEIADRPLTSRYLLDRLNPDHPNAVRTRRVALATILEETEIVHGDVDDLDESIGFFIARELGE